MKQILSALLLFVGLTSTQAEIIPQIANINARQVKAFYVLQQWYKGK